MIEEDSGKANKEEPRADNNMKAVEPSGYKKSCAVDSVCDCKWGFIVFSSLEEGKIPS
jgi:hypothetical protein